MRLVIIWQTLAILTCWVFSPDALVKVNKLVWLAMGLLLKTSLLLVVLTVCVSAGLQSLSSCSCSDELPEAGD